MYIVFIIRKRLSTIKKNQTEGVQDDPQFQVLGNGKGGLSPRGRLAWGHPDKWVCRFQDIELIHTLTLCERPQAKRTLTVINWLQHTVPTTASFLFYFSLPPSDPALSAGGTRTRQAEHGAAHALLSLSTLCGPEQRPHLLSLCFLNLKRIKVYTAHQYNWILLKESSTWGGPCRYFFHRMVSAGCGS